MRSTDSEYSSNTDSESDYEDSYDSEDDECFIPKITKDNGEFYDYENLELEKANKELLRTITLNLSDKYQFIDDPCRIVKVSQYYQSLLLKYVMPYAKYDVFLEYSIPENWGEFHGKNKISRLHIHGILLFKSIKDKMAFYIESAHNLYRDGVGEMDAVNNISKWLTYITKENKLVKEYCQYYSTNWYFNQNDKYPQLYGTWFPTVISLKKANHILDQLKGSQ